MKPTYYSHATIFIKNPYDGAKELVGTMLAQYIRMPDKHMGATTLANTKKILLERAKFVETSILVQLYADVIGYDYETLKELKKAIGNF